MLQKYEEIPYAWFIQDEYSHLAARSRRGFSGYDLPHIGEVIQEVWQTVDMGQTEQKIHEAIQRKDHEIFGMPQEEFKIRAYRNELPGFQTEPIPAKEIEQAVYMFLRSRYISFMNYDGEVVNPPCGGGVW